MGCQGHIRAAWRFTRRNRAAWRFTRRRHSQKHLALAASLAVLGLVASASPAPASVTIGQLAPESPPSAFCGPGAFDRAQLSVLTGESYVVPAVPAAGTITSWSHNAAAGSGQMLTMKVFRKVAEPAFYTIVGHDGPRPLAPGLLNTFKTSIPVKPGDLLGHNPAGSSSNTACAFQPLLGDGYLGRAGDLVDGDSAAFNVQSDLRLNITAVVSPTNTFAFGGIRRNKKKGTATLTVDVPNPGELALYGKGVRPARSAGAVASKTVTAPGEVKLLIKAKGKKKRKLNDTGKVKLNVAITYTPTGGDPSTQSRKLTLKKRLKKR